MEKPILNWSRNKDGPNEIRENELTKMKKAARPLFEKAINFQKSLLNFNK